MKIIMSDEDHDNIRVDVNQYVREENTYIQISAS